MAKNINQKRDTFRFSLRLGAALLTCWLSGYLQAAQSSSESDPANQAEQPAIAQGSSQGAAQGISPPVSAIKLDKQDIVDIKTVLTQVLIDDQSQRTLIQEKKEISHNLSIEKRPTDTLQNEIALLWQKQRALDKQNQDIIANILDTYGWPKQKVFKGSEAAQTIFIVIQHAPLEFQERFFPMMQKATENGDIPKGAFASLHDSILVGQGLKQRYGTQIKVDENTGRPFFYAIEDEKNVDIRRAAVGLGPLIEYAAVYGVDYYPKPKVKTEELVIDNRNVDTDSEDKPY